MRIEAMQEQLQMSSFDGNDSSVQVNPLTPNDL
jgi:hypothetical protein